LQFSPYLRKARKIKAKDLKQEEESNNLGDLQKNLGNLKI
jgi:hypothetical protein